jgi:hypothetical protein
MFNLFGPRPTDPRRDFLEGFLFYWFSEHGFKCAKVERNGIDFLARNLATKELLGIAIRSANPTEDRVVVSRENLDDARASCAGFDAVPWFAFAAVGAGSTLFFVTGAERLLDMFAAGMDAVEWSLGPEAQLGYRADPTVMSIEVNHKAWRWWQTSS